MKIIEKKCPNCGANLPFESDAKEAKCNYCNQEFIIEHDKNSFDDLSKLSSDSFTLQKKIVKTFSAIHIIIIFIVLIVIGTTFVLITNQIKSNDLFGEKVEESTVKISNIDNDTFIMIHDTSIEKLKLYSKVEINDYKKGEYEYVGSYIYKNTFGSVLSDIFKVTYTKGNNSITVYQLVNYNDLKLKNGKVSLNYNGYVDANMIPLEENTIKYVFGYKTMEELYKKGILSKSKGNIEATNGLYID